MKNIYIFLTFSWVFNKGGYASCGLTKGQRGTQTYELLGTSQRHAELKTTLEVFTATVNSSLLHTAFM